MMDDVLEDRKKKVKKSKLWVWIFLILYMIFMFYVIKNIEYIKQSPCDVCEEKVGKTCVWMVKGLSTPTVTWDFNESELEDLEQKSLGELN